MRPKTYTVYFIAFHVCQVYWREVCGAFSKIIIWFLYQIDVREFANELLILVLRLNISTKAARFGDYVCISGYGLNDEAFCET